MTFVIYVLLTCKKIMCLVYLTDNKEWNLTLSSSHTAVLWSYFDLMKKEK